MFKASVVRRGVGLALFLVVFVIACGGSTPAPGSPQNASAVQADFDKLPTMQSMFSGGEPAPSNPEDRVKLVKQGLAAAAAADAALEKTTWDVRAVLGKVGGDPDTLFRWVRDNTAYVPYRGALRGPQGVLMDRMGNSLDRALLLWQLLAQSRHNVRLAHGQLPPEKAAQVLAAARTAHVPPASAQADVTAQIAQASGISEATLRADAQRAGAAGAKVRQAVKASTDFEVAALTKLLGTAVSGKPEPDRTPDVQDHWWVQLRNDDKTWKDYDPSLPNAEPGQALIPATDNPGYGSLADLGANAHTVTIQVTVESWKNGKLVESAALKKKLIPGDLHGTVITLSQAPANWPDGLNMLAPGNDQAVRDAFIAQHVWTPTLIVGTEKVVQSAFTDTGDLTAPPAGPPHTGMGNFATGNQGISGGFGRMGGALGGAQSPPPTPETPTGSGQLTAEWIDYLIEVPGKPASKIRRQIFDLLGPAVRAAGGNVPQPEMAAARRLERGLNVLSEHEILLLGSQLSPEFLAHVTRANDAANADSLTRLAKLDRAHAKSDDLLAIAQSFQGARLPLLQVALVRSLWSSNPGNVYLDQPTILGFHDIPGINSAGHISGSEGYDLVDNEVAVRPGVNNPSGVRIAQGILDTNVESALLRIRIGGRRGLKPVVSAADALRARSDGWLVVRSAADPAWSSVKLPPDVRARIAADIAAGFAVVLPASPTANSGGEAATWWRVDQQRGTILGMGDRGWGQAMVEYLEFVAGLIHVVFEAKECDEEKIPHAQDTLFVFANCACQVLAGMGMLALSVGLEVAEEGALYALGAVDADFMVASLMKSVCSTEE